MVVTTATTLNCTTTLQLGAAAGQGLCYTLLRRYCVLLTTLLYCVTPELFQLTDRVLKHKKKPSSTVLSSTQALPRQDVDPKAYTQFVTNPNSRIAKLIKNIKMEITILLYEWIQVGEKTLPQAFPFSSKVLLGSLKYYTLNISFLVSTTDPYISN